MGNDTSQLIDQLALLSSDKTSPSVQARHAWDVRDKSRNIDVKNDGLMVNLLYIKLLVHSYTTYNAEILTNTD